jgi:hypothetical protein
MTLNELRFAVDKLDWTYAKTMPKYPHWYIKRNPEIEKIYVELFNAIGEHGKHEFFFRKPTQYLYLGDGYKYWRMATDINDSKILNRAKEDAIYVSK